MICLSYIFHLTPRVCLAPCYAVITPVINKVHVLRTIRRYVKINPMNSGFFKEATNKRHNQDRGEKFRACHKILDIIRDTWYKSLFQFINSWKNIIKVNCNATGQKENLQLLFGWPGFASSLTNPKIKLLLHFSEAIILAANIIPISPFKRHTGWNNSDLFIVRAFNPYNSILCHNTNIRK